MSWGRRTIPLGKGKVSMRPLNDLRVLPWIAVATLVVAAVIALPSHHNAVYARMQEPDLSTAAATPVDYAEFQYATLTGTTNTINATMVPVVYGAKVTYKDITIPVTVSATGVVSVGAATVVASPVIQANNFKAGTYVAPSNMFGGKGLVVVSGPGVTAGGATEWSLAAAAGADGCTYPVAATWYVGPPTAANNPLAARLKKAGITSTAYSYGVLGGSSAGCPDNHFDPGSLIGASQTGNSLTVVSFSYNGGTTDYNTPQESLPFLYSHP